MLRMVTGRNEQDGKKGFIFLNACTQEIIEMEGEKKTVRSTPEISQLERG